MSEPSSRTLTAGIGPGSLLSTDLPLRLGADHPSGHGSMRLQLTLEGDRILTADPIVGFVHRGAEKLFEARDYRQIITLANRHDWVAPFAGELGVALAVERMLGIPVPARALWLRTLFAELTRLSSHWAFLGSFPTVVGQPVIGAAGLLRERLLELFEEATGARMHLMWCRVGGLVQDVPAGWLGRVGEAVSSARERMPELETALLHRDDMRALTSGVGVLPRELVLSHGVTGPAARASGVDVDLRRDQPYLGYGELFTDGGPGRVPTRTAGDARSRLEVMIEQCQVSLDLVDACLEQLSAAAPGPVNIRLPKLLTVPEGEEYVATEGPLGWSGYYVVSRGEETPWRVKMRTASFNNVAVLAALLPGQFLLDLPTILASLAFVLGDVDK